MSRLYRFHYRRQREVIVPAQIQIAESPKNLGRFKAANTGLQGSAIATSAGEPYQAPF
jgi:hypothetical protein